MTLLLRKSEVGYDGEFIGVYYAETPEEAKELCMTELKWARMELDLLPSIRREGLIANDITDE